MGTGAAKGTKEGRVQAAGSDGFLLGVNIPYFDYGWDFGGSPQVMVGGKTFAPLKGVSEDAAKRKSPAYTLSGGGGQLFEDPLGEAYVDEVLKTIAEHGIHAVRWFMLFDGRGRAIDYDPTTKLPTGITQSFREDVTKALELLDKHALLVNFVLFDHKWSYRAVPLAGGQVQKYGRGRLLKTPEGRKALLEKVLIPTFDLVGKHKRLLAFELLNEPEFLVDGMEAHDPSPKSEDGVELADRIFLAERTVAGKKYSEDFQAFLAWGIEVRKEVLARTSARFSLGLHRLNWLDRWLTLFNPADGDFLNVHLYNGEGDRFDAANDLYALSYAEVKKRMMGKALPVVWGEFPPDPCHHCPPSGSCLLHYLQRALANGYAGAWPWSWLGLLPDQGCKDGAGAVLSKEGTRTRPRIGKDEPKTLQLAEPTLRPPMLRMIMKEFAKTNAGDLQLAGAQPPT